MSKEILFITTILVLSLVSCSKPIAECVYKMEEIRVPTKVKFSNKSQNAERYEWNFGDGSTSNEVSPKHTYWKSGKHEIELKAIKGNKSSIYKTEIEIESPVICLVEIATNVGNMLITLSDETPNHRENFLEMIDQKVYDGLIFHRVINGFVIQGGDISLAKNKQSVDVNRLSKMTIPSEINEKMVHIKGALAAARMPDDINPEKKSSKTQFYIVHGSSLNENMIKDFYKNKSDLLTDKIKNDYLKYGGSPQLDGEYSIFGQLIEGESVLNKIANVITNDRDQPLEDVKIISIKLVQ
jgi:cyclophilin family peptidyl-prolyl cis-trans isomerase